MKSIFRSDTILYIFLVKMYKREEMIKKMWWCLIPVLILSAIALISYQSGKELKEDIKKKLV